MYVYVLLAFVICTMRLQSAMSKLQVLDVICHILSKLKCKVIVVIMPSGK